MWRVQLKATRGERKYAQGITGSGKVISNRAYTDLMHELSIALGLASLQFYMQQREESVAYSQPHSSIYCSSLFAHYDTQMPTAYNSVTFNC
jgi:hypothetical protein